MAVNSPEPTLFCVIMLCVWLSILFDQDVPSLDFVVFFVFVVVDFIVVGNLLSGREGYVVIYWVTIICLTDGRSGRGWIFLGVVSPCRRCGPRRGGAIFLGQFFPQPPPTEIHPTPSPDWYR